VLTTGGTGPARRDVTPEATLAVATREMPGFGEQMRRISLAFVPTAILSRQVGVLRETAEHAALIINLPGQPKAIAETLEGLKDADGRTLAAGIFAAVPYCIELIGGPYVETNPRWSRRSGRSRRCDPTRMTDSKRRTRCSNTASRCKPAPRRSAR
jgi:molybdopterin adenylyltransferase